MGNLGFVLFTSIPSTKLTGTYRYFIGTDQLYVLFQEIYMMGFQMGLITTLNRNNTAEGKKCCFGGYMWVLVCSLEADWITTDSEWSPEKALMRYPVQTGLAAWVRSAKREQKTNLLIGCFSEHHYLGCSCDRRSEMTRRQGCAAGEKKINHNHTGWLHTEGDHTCMWLNEWVSSFTVFRIYNSAVNI